MRHKTLRIAGIALAAGLGFLGLSAGRAEAQGYGPYDGPVVVERAYVTQRPVIVKPRKVVIRRPRRVYVAPAPVVAETRVIQPAPVVQRTYVQPAPVIERRVIQPPPVIQERVIQGPPVARDRVYLPEPVYQTRYRNYPY